MPTCSRISSIIIPTHMMMLVFLHITHASCITVLSENSVRSKDIFRFTPQTAIKKALADARASEFGRKHEKNLFIKYDDKMTSVLRKQNSCQIFIQARYQLTNSKKASWKTNWPVISARDLLKMIANQITDQTFWKY